jgi:hypothetical protein
MRNGLALVEYGMEPLVMSSRALRLREASMVLSLRLRGVDGLLRGRAVT